ncbi:MAG: tetratricopeptide repeat protein [Pseudomonadota bacterium]
MKKTCILCGKAKAKRTCQLHENDVICPVCCATTREPSCEGCRYYTVAQQYQASKAHHDGSKHFFAEINEDVFKEVDRALILCEQGLFPEAHTILQDLLPAHPRNHHVFYGIGLYHALQGNDDEALGYFDLATDIFPYFIEAYFNKGLIYKNKQDIKRMLNAYQTVIKIGDPQGEAVKQAREILQGLEQSLRESDNITLETYLKGMEMFDRAFEVMNDKKWEQAIRLFQQCIGYHPRHPQSYGNMGICYGQLGQKALALRAFDTALELDPQYEPAIVNRAVVESLQEGETLPQGKVETIDYYKDYPRNKKSYIQTVVEQSKKVLPS